MNKGIIHHYFSEPVSTNISSVKSTYLNSFETLSPYREGYQMSDQGPDYYVFNYREVKNPLKLKLKMKEACEYLPIGRKIRQNYYSEYWKNSQGKSRVLVILASEIRNQYFRLPGNKLFLIPCEIETYFVTFAPITGKQYKFLKSKCDGKQE